MMAGTYARPDAATVRVIRRIRARHLELHDRMHRTDGSELMLVRQGLQEALAIMAEELGLDPEVIA